MRPKLFFGQEWLGFEGAVALLDEHLHFAFGGVELLLAGSRKAYALFEELERFVEREIAFLELVDDGFEFLERLFEGRHSIFSIASLAERAPISDPCVRSNFRIGDNP